MTGSREPTGECEWSSCKALEVYKLMEQEPRLGGNFKVNEFDLGQRGTDERTDIGSITSECRDMSIKRPKSNAGIIIGVCAGIAGGLFLLIASGWLYKVMKKRNDKKRKENFFKRNGGFLLQHKLSSNDGSEKIKLFNSKELEKATDHYHEDRILGQGG
ncbi:hypothetical protein ACSBR1_026634 [Camellia fascicularis]